MELPKVDESKPLHVQLRELRETLRTQFGRKDLQEKDFIGELDYSDSTIRRAWDEEEGRSPNVAVSLGVARLLGLSTEYSALVLVRDELARERATLQREGGRPAKPQRAAAIAKLLADLAPLVRSLNPFRSAHRNRRLAVRALRIASGLTHRRALRALKFERGQQRLDDTELRTLVAELGATWERFGSLMKALHRVHPIARRELDGTPGSTVEHVLTVPQATSRDAGVWTSPGKSQPELRWYCPPGAGHISLHASPTLWGAITCEILTATVAGALRDPEPTARSRVRCVGARHEGYELAVVTDGAMLLTVSDDPFGAEAPEATPAFATGPRVDHRVYRAGDVVAFDSGRYHRCEFLAAYNRCVSFNIARSVLLHGKLGPRDVTSEA